MAISGDEVLYQQACAALDDRNAPIRGNWSALPLLVITIVLFAIAILWIVGSASPLVVSFIALLIGVLLFHEAGHYLGMTLFGYRDVRMFFIPFFGGAVTGRKHAAPGWQQAIVLLLGPLPGLALAALIVAFKPEGNLALAAYLLLLINGFNLLPFAPLDGGKLLQLLLFARHPLSELVFLMISGIGLAVVGWIQQLWIIVGLGLVILLTAPFQYRRRMARLASLRQLPTLPDDISLLTDKDRRALFHSARALIPNNSNDPREFAGEMKKLHEAAVTKPAAPLANLGLLSLYLAGIALTLIFDPLGIVRGISNLGPTPIVGQLTATFELPPGEKLILQQRGMPIEVNPRKGYKLIGVTLDVDGNQTLVTGDYVVLSQTGGEYRPLGIRTPNGIAYARDYARRVDLHHNPNVPVATLNGQISELALTDPEITLLYELPAEYNQFQLRHDSDVYDLQVQPPQPKPDE
jgi:hypothetical protein